MLKNTIKFGLFEGRRVFGGPEGSGKEAPKTELKGEVVTTDEGLDRECRKCELTVASLERHNKVVIPGANKGQKKVELIAIGEGFEVAKKMIGEMLNRLKTLSGRDYGSQDECERAVRGVRVRLDGYHIATSVDGLKLLVHIEGQVVDVRELDITDELLTQLATHHVDRVNSEINIDDRLIAGGTMRFDQAPSNIYRPTPVTAPTVSVATGAAY